MAGEAAGAMAGEAAVVKVAVVKVAVVTAAGARTIAVAVGKAAALSAVGPPQPVDLEIGRHPEQGRDLVD